MRLVCIEGPMDGATYVLDGSSPSTTRKPNGLWFDGQDEHGRWVQHQYKECRAAERKGDSDFGGLSLYFRYIGPVVDTGIDFETGGE